MDGNFAANGCAIVEKLISQEEARAIAEDIDQHAKEALAGARNPHHFSPAVRQFIRDRRLRALLEPVLGPSPRVVRSIFFDKTPEANWRVAWHQDLTICVRRKIELPGFGPWSSKDGMPHTQPPVEILEQMAAVRLHLDDCDADNGPLRVLPGTHMLGRLTSEKIAACRARIPESACLAGAGGVVIMRPLLLHASSPARVPRRRRVVHIEFAAGDLPGGLEWWE